MDVALARTFLEVVATGSFVAAAEALNVTQSTVSARIKSLEDQLGRRLFERSKAGAALTPAGEQFQRHASAMMRVWEQARLEVSLPEGYRAALTVGAHLSLWDGYLMAWLAGMRKRAPDIALRTQHGDSRALMQRLTEGTLDLGVMYRPESRPGLTVEQLFEDELVLVSTRRDTGSGLAADHIADGYVYVDWGPEFAADHAASFPQLSTPALYMELGSLSLAYLLANGGSGYFPRAVVEPHIAQGRLFRVRRAPVFAYPAYAVYAADNPGEALRAALDGLYGLGPAER